MTRLALAAWRVLVKRKVLDAEPMVAVGAAPGSRLFTQGAGLLAILLEHQDVPPELIIVLTDMPSGL